MKHFCEKCGRALQEFNGRAMPCAFCWKAGPILQLIDESNLPRLTFNPKAGPPPESFPLPIVRFRRRRWRDGDQAFYWEEEGESFSGIDRTTMPAMEWDEIAKHSTKTLLERMKRGLH